ncbi:GH22374 [Drosophila grimshawi]|uniref:GH22374 n=1 Tax=Drosophila grimshawi TaxID=7222 RepID=B4JYV9_DROGR|nr:GH22374 [Drosophila grimshawi]
MGIATNLITDGPPPDGRTPTDPCLLVESKRVNANLEYCFDLLSDHGVAAAVLLGNILSRLSKFSCEGVQEEPDRYDVILKD